jgi:NADH-quinone oxidoreductase subunit J
MAPTLFSACVLGAVALYLLLRPGNQPLRVGGTVLGLGALVWLVRETTLALGGGGPGTLFWTFGLIAVAAAVRMITQPRPVYAALYFVLVVVASAAIFLLLQAEFMAFALVIVYAGAILITYLFVLMLAQPAGEPEEGTAGAEYDRVPREPAAAAVVGLVLLATLGDMLAAGAGVRGLPPPPTALEVKRSAWVALEQMPDRLQASVAAAAEDLETIVAQADGRRIRVHAGGEAAVTIRSDAGELRDVALPESAMPENIERVGLDLMGRFPASLELAGVILLLAMWGAVVLAQRHIEAPDEPRGGSPLPGGAP